MLTPGQLSPYLPTTAPAGYGMAPVTPQYTGQVITGATVPTAAAPATPNSGATIAGNISDILGIIGNTAGKVIQAGFVPTSVPTPPPSTPGAMQIPMLQVTPKPATA